MTICLIVSVYLSLYSTMIYLLVGDLIVVFTMHCTTSPDAFINPARFSDENVVDLGQTQ